MGIGQDKTFAGLYIFKQRPVQTAQSGIGKRKHSAVQLPVAFRIVEQRAEHLSLMLGSRFFDKTIRFKAVFQRGVPFHTDFLQADQVGSKLPDEINDEPRPRLKTQLDARIRFRPGFRQKIKCKHPQITSRRPRNRSPVIQYEVPLLIQIEGWVPGKRFPGIIGEKPFPDNPGLQSVHKNKIHRL